MGGIVCKPSSKVVAPSKTYWSPPGQRPCCQQKWGYILVPVWWPYLWWWIHKGNLHDLWWKIQRTPEGSLTRHHHSSNTGHLTTQQNFQIIEMEGYALARNIKESIFTMVNHPTLNKDIGKFNLPHIWDRVLLNSPGLTLKRHAQAVEQANSNQPNIPTHLHQPNIPTHLGQSNSSMHIFTGSEHAHRTS